MKKGSVLIKIVNFCCFSIFFSCISFAEKQIMKNDLTEMQSEQRVALVIGNGDYKSSPLPKILSMMPEPCLKSLKNWDLR
ncbi:Uncharacterized protein dnm_018640 [Desulfonema magnum]|uniref:Uncharacterized protein n=1 Tax=Desulfonema magnum TaxID=45655 RepID=A0A975BHI5_9BACT|nr:Uncharacterized protein dnm_018640 [Desulfonema magnum]